jgi:hypothetical protein
MLSNKVFKISSIPWRSGKSEHIEAGTERVQTDRQTGRGRQKTLVHRRTVRRTERGRHSLAKWEEFKQQNWNRKKTDKLIGQRETADTDTQAKRGREWKRERERERERERQADIRHARDRQTDKRVLALPGCCTRAALWRETSSMTHAGMVRFSLLSLLVRAGSAVDFHAKEKTWR